MHQKSKFYLCFSDRVKKKKKVCETEHMTSVCPFCILKKTKTTWLAVMQSSLVDDTRKRKLTSISAKERKPGQSKQSRAWVQKKKERGE